MPEIGTQTKRHVLVTEIAEERDKRLGEGRGKKEPKSCKKERVFGPETDYSEESTTNQRSFSGPRPREVVQDTKLWPCWEVLRDRESVRLHEEQRERGVSTCLTSVLS